MTIYLDVIWLLNFFFDLLLLLLTAIILKRTIKFWRMVVGAMIASTIVLLYFTSFQGIISHPMTKLLYSIFIVLATFGFLNFRYFIKNLVTFYFITFMVGGGLLGLHYFFQSDIEFADGVLATSSGGFGDPVSWIFVVVGFPLVWYFSKRKIEDIEVKKIQYDQIVDVQVDLGQDIVFLKGLIDSGNQLYDPITKYPVMILDLHKAEMYLPKTVIRHCQNVQDLNFEEIDPNWARRYRVIPYRAVGHDHQFLLAIKPDKVVLKLHEEPPIVVTKVLIGLNQTPLSSEGDYDCIIHPKMLIKKHHIIA